MMAVNGPEQGFDISLLAKSVGVTKPDLPSQQSNKQGQTSSRKKQRDGRLQSKFDTRLGDAALRQAVEGGYLMSPTRAFLLDRCKTSNQQTRSLKEIEYIHLTNFHVRSLGHIQSCRHLRVCILHNNYLTRFNALENCPCLIRLDLHSNQITKLPDEQFWEKMESLQVLNLHDNGIGKLESVQALSACPSLVALTLYDTPLSLKHNYRHHTVNTIWSLKAIDHHVVGDEEIIEDAIFSKRFIALNPALMVDLCPKETEPVQERTIEMEMKTVRKILSDINQILVHGSPVIVIQRWIRGHLSRRKQKISFFEISQKLKKMSLRSQTHTTPGGSQAGEAIGLDYDTYLRNRRPGSKTPSGAAHTQPMTPKQLDANKTDNKESLILKDFPTSLHINLAKLEQNALRSFDNSPDEGITIHVHHESGLPAKSLFSKPLTVTFLQDEQRDSPQKFSAPVSTPATAPSKKREPVTVQQMLGPTKALVRPGLNQPHPVLGTLIEGGRDKQMREVAVQCQPDVEVPNHEWRIHDKAFEIGGGKPTLAEIEPTQEHLIMNREAGRDIREAIEYWHEQEYSKPRPQAKKHNPSPRLRDNVSLATLMAVSKAYRDRDKNDLISMKVDRVMRIQQERMQAKHIVTAYKEEKRSTAMSQRQEDRLRIAEALQQQEINKNAYVEYAQERKERALQRHRTRHAELMFASDFGNQHTSVSNALIRHDRQAAKEDVKADKEDIVSGVKMQLSEQAELVRRYMEHKQISRQMKSGQEKSKFDTQILQETNDRLLAAKQRVAGIKARKAAVQAFHHSLPATANASSWPVVVSRNHPQQNDPDNPNHDALPKVKTSTAPVLRIHEADHVNDTLELPPVPPFPSASGDMVSPRQLSNVSSTLAVQS